MQYSDTNIEREITSLIRTIIASQQDDFTEQDILSSLERKLPRDFFLANEGYLSTLAHSILVSCIYKGSLGIRKGKYRYFGHLSFSRFANIGQ